MPGQNLQPIDPGGKLAGQRSAALVLGFGHFAGRAGVVGTDAAPDAMRLQKARALRQDHDMAVGFPDVLDLCTGHAQKVHMHADESLVHDVQARTRQQRMHVGHPAISRILDRKHAKIDLALGDLLHDLVESRAGNRLEIRARLLAGLVRIGPEFALKRDATGHLASSLVENLPHGAFRRASTP